MRKFKAVCYMFGILFAVVVFGFAVQNEAMAQGQDFVESVGTNGKVNWTQGYVEAIGIGAPPESSYGKPNARPMALRAGKLDAYRNLLEVVKGVRIDSATEVKDFTVSSDTIRAQVEGLVKGAQVIKQDYMSDGTVEVTIRMSLNGDLAQAVLPIPKVIKSETFDRPVGPIAPQAPVKTSTTPAAPAAPQAMVFTGMVIDARGIQARPAMAPKIIDESGQEVYGSMQVDREFAVQQGMSGYARDLSSAQNNARVTNNPVTLKGVKTDGPGKSNIVISNADAQKVRSSAENLSFLKKARVMIVLD
ncbi:MAG: hypothetical protein ABFD62_01190 [Syntrophaceae bacterium]